MRRFLQHNRWATLLVASFFVLATSGVEVSRMTCLLGGHTSLSLGSFADCCPDNENDGSPTVAPECCEFGTARSEHTDYLPHQDVDLLPALLALDSSPRLLLSDERPVNSHDLKSRPPPLSANGRLVWFCVQRV